MNYHHDPGLAAWAIHMIYCPLGRAATPEEIGRRMGISAPAGSGDRILEEIGRRVLADPSDIPAFATALAELLRK